MRRVVNLLFGLVLGLALQAQALAAPADLSNYVIPLHSRPAEELIPLLQPFLHPEGAIGGEGQKILLKTSEKNYRDLLQIVAEMDVSQRQLRISVTLDQELAEAENRALAGTAPETANKPVLQDMQGRSYQTPRQEAPLVQQVQSQEGRWAKISSGESIPVGQRTRNPDGTITESVTYKSVNSGFQVLPRLNGDRVTLFIIPQLENMHPEGGGRIETRSAETTVSGKLNQWLLVGGKVAVEVTQPGSRVYSTAKRKSSNNPIYVKVEVVQ